MRQCTLVLQMNSPCSGLLESIINSYLPFDIFHFFLLAFFSDYCNQVYILFPLRCRWSPKEDHSIQTALGKQLCDTIVPLIVDATTEYLSEQCNTILERVVGPADSDKFANCVQAYVLTKCHRLLVDQSVADRFVCCCCFFSFITLPKLCTIRCVSTYFSWVSGYKVSYNL